MCHNFGCLFIFISFSQFSFFLSVFNISLYIFVLFIFLFVFFLYPFVGPYSHCLHFSVFPHIFMSFWLTLFYDYMLQSLICSQFPPFSFPHPLFGCCVCGCMCNVCVCAHASKFWYCSCLIPHHSGPAVGQAE